MIDLGLIHLALWNRATGLVVCTTGSVDTLSATATGYHRSAGSFVTDGFAPGMELAPTGFTQTALGVISAVTASDLTITGGRTVQAIGNGRTLAVGLPQMRALENDKTFTPISGRPYVLEEFVPATHTLITFPASGGKAEETGLYVLKWFGLSQVGILALRRSVEALRKLYAPGTTMAAGSDTVRVRGDTAAQTGQLIPLDGGFTALVLTIPWVARSTNVIAA